MVEDLFVPQIKESTVDVVINNIKNLLLNRKLLPGDRLPNEMELSKRLGVSRGSVREAIKILSAYGVIEVKVGDGTYIASSLRKGMLEPLLYSFLLSKNDIMELAEFRRYIEMDIAEMIIDHAAENHQYIEEMKNNVEKIPELKKAGAPLEAFIENEVEFHRLYGKACCNLLVEKVYNYIMDFLNLSIRDTHFHQDPGTKSYESHKSIIEAIEKKDPQVARDAINHAIDIWHELQKA